MAGICVPTMFLLLTMSVFAYHRYYLEVPSQFIFGLPAQPLARAFFFPMAVVPSLWGVWNMIHLALRSRLRISL